MPATKKTYRVTFANTTATRTSEATYTHAAIRRERYGWKITFHKTYAAARRTAGSDSGVKRVEVVS